MEKNANNPDGYYCNRCGSQDLNFNYIEKIFDEFGETDRHHYTCNTCNYPDVKLVHWIKLAFEEKDRYPKLCALPKHYIDWHLRNKK